MRRTLLAAAVLLLAGCASAPPTTTATGSVAAAVPSTVAADAAPATTDAPDPLPADEVVVRVRTGDGYWSRSRATFEIPSLVILGDGTVYSSVSSEDYATPQVWVDEVDPSAVAEVVAAVTADGVIGADLGRPGVTDWPTTTVSVWDAGALRTATAYALGSESSGVDLSDDQLAARQRLQQVIGRLGSLTSDSRPWMPDRVRVERLWSDSMVLPGTYPEWTGPDPATIPRVGDRVEVIDGAAELYAAARANPVAVWTVPGGQAVLAVVPLLPGEPA